DGTAREAVDASSHGPALVAAIGERFVGPVIVSPARRRAAVLATVDGASHLVEMDFEGGVTVTRGPTLNARVDAGAAPLDADLTAWVAAFVRADGTSGVAHLTAEATEWTDVVASTD